MPKLREREKVCERECVCVCCGEEKSIFNVCLLISKNMPNSMFSIFPPPLLREFQCSTLLSEERYIYLSSP